MSRALSACRISLLALFAASCAGRKTVERPASPQIEAFSGEVEAGRGFERTLRSGLVFQLRPGAVNGDGYSIWLIDKDHPGDNLCMVVTGPFHGPNPLEIEAYELVSEETARMRNLPYKRRSFRCVAGETEYQEASWALDRVLWALPPGEPSGNAEKARRISERYGRTALEGELEIREIRFAASDARPAIRSLRFDARIAPPSAKP